MNSVGESDEESGGFKFAITLLATFGTIIYASFTYFQNYSVDNYFYVVIVGVIVSLLISSIFLIGYILVRGYSMEGENSAKPILKKFASDIYSITFQVGILQLVLIIGLFLLIQYVSRSLWLASLFWLGVVWGMLYTSTFGYIQGRVTIDMNSIYNKNDEPIPVNIEVTGRNDNASIELYQLSFTNPIATLELETKYNSSKNLNRENSTLIGNAFYYGKYYVFINTTELREGYYELVYTRHIDGYKYGKSFYLLNAS